MEGKWITMRGDEWKFSGGEIYASGERGVYFEEPRPKDSVLIIQGINTERGTLTAEMLYEFIHFSSKAEHWDDVVLRIRNDESELVSKLLEQLQREKRITFEILKASESKYESIRRSVNENTKVAEVSFIG